ncbi:MAG TPA: single-stranded-DNA-specific exonuclease RecJ [Thermoanaerobaculia bacterium]|nr:single-stranded-DNA-specific exonuclease RecJ [Thermoanaerobaculia bacterium]
MPARWIEASPPPAAGDLQGDGIPPVLAGLLAQRGCRDRAEAERFLEPTLDQLHAPDRLRGLPEAAERLAAACREGARVAVVGDYDVDGVSATALLAAVLGATGAEPVPMIGRRHEEGYGFLSVHVERAAAAGAEILVAVDCGTNSHEAVAAARQRGLAVIVADHHLPEGPAPEGAILINPRQPECDYPDPHLTGAGLALKLAVGLLERRGRSVPWEALLRIACLGTIADVAPLVGENRVIAALGLRALAEARSPGLRELMRLAEVRPPLRAVDVGFRLGPRLNAPGRLGQADAALELLLAREPARAREVAAELEARNRERQREEARVLAEARAALEGEAGESGILVAWGEGWTRGVVGIAAGRLARETGRPVVLLAVDGELATGSGRSPAGIHLHDFLVGWRQRLERFGGHATAIGLTARTQELEGLCREWRVAARQWPAALLEPELRYDAELPAAAIDDRLLEALERLEPFGHGNEEPVFRVRELRVGSAPRRFGRGHASVEVSIGGARAEMVAWGRAERAGELAGTLDALVRVERDRFRGGLRLALVDARPAGAPATLESPR